MRKTFTLVLLTCALTVTASAQLDSPGARFLLGPQTKAGAELRAAWFDKTQHEQGLRHGDAFPPAPPADPAALNQYVLNAYYDLPYHLYLIHDRTGDARHLQNARKAADSWWKHPWWGEGRQRSPDSADPSPRHAGVGGLILRAADGRPEMWDGIYWHVRRDLDLWLKSRLDSPELYYGLREGAFALHHAVWLSAALPDSYPLQAGGAAADGARKRAALLADSEEVAVRYLGRLQRADGSWRWRTSADEFRWDDGGTLEGTMQPFMVGLLLTALSDLHALSTNEAVRTSVLAQITKGCRHLYEGGPYRRDELTGMGTVRWRSFWYFYHGGTSANPTRFERGGGSPARIADTNAEWWFINSERQGISTILPAFGYALQQTKDPWFKQAGDELFDAAYSGADGQRALLADTAKNFNQHKFVGRYLAWAATPVVTPTPVRPTPTPTPTATPNPMPVMYECATKVWPSAASARLALLNQMGADGYQLAQVISSTAYFCRPKG